MASVADSFLDDLDELSDGSEVEDERDEQQAEALEADAETLQVGALNSKKRRREDAMEPILEDEDEDEDEDEEDDDGHGDVVMETRVYKNGNGEVLEGVVDPRRVLDAVNRGQDFEAVACLRRSSKYKEHMQTMAKYEQRQQQQHQQAELMAEPLEEGSEEYNFVVSSNDLMVQLDDEIAAVHLFLTERYRPKFPELENLVPNALDYVRTVQLIGNETDLTVVPLASILPSAAVISVSVAGSATSGHLLDDAELATCRRACEEVLALQQDKEAILAFVESRMTLLAPNVSQLVGTRIAAQLVGLAGGVAKLARIPACNIQVLGQQRKVLAGFSSAAALKHTGVIFTSDLVQGVSPPLRMKACRAVAGKLALMARVDSQPHRDGHVGAQFRAELQAKFTKWEEPQKAKTKKALPIPDEKPRRKRGGRRYRKIKERLQMTDVRRELNRETFGAAEDEYGDNAMGLSIGRLGQEGSGTLRIQRKEQRQSTKKLRQASVAAASRAGSVPMSGLASSLAFTPVQGIELANPEAARKRVEEANKKYFSSTSGFVSVVRKP